MMDQTPAWRFLCHLWSNAEHGRLTCCSCALSIAADQCLARTFRLESWDAHSGDEHAERIPVPEYDDAILIYHRHISCLFESTRIIVISHVWHPPVADLQYRKLDATCSVEEVESIVRQVPVNIARSLAKHIGVQERFEMWHDYISVPQWAPDIKRRIILEIPTIFSRAFMTVAHLSDVDMSSVVNMRQGPTAAVRCRGISDICNSTWFSRVWTAMELTQSGQLHALIKDFIVVDVDEPHASFIDEFYTRWSNECAVQEHNYAAEQMAGMGYNLVPWQLGPIRGAKLRASQGMTTPFATAYQILSRRCVTVSRDFFHAILAILKTDVTERELDDDPKMALLQIAKSCLRGGDLSPLLMIPGSVQTVAGDAEMQTTGYLDLITFAIDDEMSAEEPRPTFPHVDFRRGNPVVQLECLGAIQMIRWWDWGNTSTMRSFLELSRLAVQVTGLDVDEFAITVAVRLYGQELDQVNRRLEHGGRRKNLETLIRQLFDAGSENGAMRVAGSIAETLGLTNSESLGGGYHGTYLSPLEFVNNHGGSIHLGQAAAIVGVNCSTCHKVFLLRVALLRKPSDMIGLKAYRIPGLRYRFTHQGGCGFFLKDGVIVARFVWGSPTCGCPQVVGGVEISLEGPLDPRPNLFKYGDRERGWRLHFAEKSINWTANRQSGASC